MGENEEEKKENRNKKRSLKKRGNDFWLRNAAASVLVQLLDGETGSNVDNGRLDVARKRLLKKGGGGKGDEQ